MHYDTLQAKRIKSTRFEPSNTEGAALLKSSIIQTRVFMKSEPKMKKLLDIYKKSRTAEKLPLFCSGINTSLTMEGAEVKKISLLAVVLLVYTR